MHRCRCGHLVGKIKEVIVMVLDQEVETYRRHKESLLDREGQFVLIQGDKVVGVWPTCDEALTQGYDRFGFDQFMVRKIERVEKTYYFSRSIIPCQSSKVVPATKALS
jgi:hypothetical protein